MILKSNECVAYASISVKLISVSAEEGNATLIIRNGDAERYTFSAKKNVTNTHVLKGVDIVSEILMIHYLEQIVVVRINNEAFTLHFDKQIDIDLTGKIAIRRNVYFKY